jgi:uncharacterized protein YjlB
MADPKVLSYLFDDDGTFPNSRLPLLAYPRAAGSANGDRAAFFEKCFKANGWPAAWRNGIYGFHHYHSTAHEALGICRGRARVQLGGPGGTLLDVAAGDAVVIPAGVAHKKVKASLDFLVVGAYPNGQHWDMKEGRPGERPEANENIGNVPLPSADPVAGANGPLMNQWR